MKRNPNWTEDELKMAINVYCKIPFIKARKSSPEIIKWAKIIGRSPSGWADDTRNRTNPKNGLCMTPTFYRAYDKYLLAITPDYEIVVSGQMIDGAKDEHTQCYLASLQHKKMLMPEKFAPDVELLAQHYDAYLKAAV